jgi:hypothetical protein
MSIRRALAAAHRKAVVARAADADHSFIATPRPQEPTMNQSLFKRAVSLSLSAFFTVSMLVGIGVLADASAPAAQMAVNGTPAPRA